MDPTISPWNVNKLEDFLHYCCPECEEKNQSRNDFIQHTQNQHPESIAYLFRFHAKEEVLDHVEKFEYTMDDDASAVTRYKIVGKEEHSLSACSVFVSQASVACHASQVGVPAKKEC